MGRRKLKIIMAKHYVTFGQVHVHSVNGKTFDKDCVAVFEARDYADGREKTFAYFGDKFFTYYHDTEFDEKTMSFFPRGYINVNEASSTPVTYTLDEVEKAIELAVYEHIKTGKNVFDYTGNNFKLTAEWINENL